MLVGGLVRSMYNGFQFKDYVEGCWAMYDLNEFLKGFGGYEEVEGEQDNGNGQKVKVKKLSAKMAIDDMPAPDAEPTDIRQKRNPDDYYIGYRRMYAGLLMKAVGIYQRTMIDAVKGGNY